MYKPLNLQQIISLRPFVDEGARLSLSRAWTGVCPEIIEAMAGDDSHDIVNTSDGLRQVWRDGYMVPHFLEVPTNDGDYYYCCPYWTARD